MMINRNARNRNPLNIRPIATPYPGQAGIDVTEPDPPYAIFVTEQAGWAQAYRLLLTYQDVHGLRTIATICKRWAPPQDENDPSAYTAVVASLTGFGSTETLDLHDPDTMMRIASAMAVMEGGHYPWNDAQKRGALIDAGLVKPPSPPPIPIT